MAVKIQPLGDRVLVKPLEKEEKTKGGIFIPDTAKEKPQDGKVLAVGPGKMSDEGKRLPMDVAVGDIVIFAASRANSIAHSSGLIRASSSAL